MRPRDLEPGNRRHRASLHLDVARSTSWLPNGKHSNVLPQTDCMAGALRPMPRWRGQSHS